MPGGARTDTVNGTYYVVMHADIAIGGTSATALPAHPARRLDKAELALPGPFRLVQR
jgi:hypothetical protein